ncbi:MAG: diphthine--ammonia ligase [archaeon]
MKLGILFSGGKDSTLALARAMEKEEVSCLITLVSENKESYMFHTPNIQLAELQAEAIGLPLIKKQTKGEKEAELADLEDAIKEAVEKHKIEGVVTGAVQSIYQAVRVQKICDKLGLYCFNPVWLLDQKKLLEEVLERGFEVIVSGFYAEPFSEKWLGRKLDKQAVTELLELSEKYSISPAGEGGEIETTVLDAPFFKKKIVVASSEKQVSASSGTLVINNAELVQK